RRELLQAHAGFVLPEDQRTLLLGARLDRGVDLLQPRLDDDRVGLQPGSCSSRLIGWLSVYRGTSA
ncbi:MAG TPA: hypothetical protein VFY45_03475, partial [Baekduia sp.]|nr:hypothetical protein [Baekduia sp.]